MVARNHTKELKSAVLRRRRSDGTSNCELPSQLAVSTVIDVTADLAASTAKGSMADSAASGGGSDSFRQLATLVSVAFAAGAATAAASYWLLQASSRSGPPEPGLAQQPLGAGNVAPPGAASAQQQQQQQPSGRKRRPAPPPLRSPFQNDKRCGGTGDASVDRCWEWLSQSEDGIQVPGPTDPPSRPGIPASQALRRHRQEEQRRRRDQQQQQQQHAEVRQRRSADASRLPSETVSDPLGISTPPQNERRSGSLPSLPPDFLHVEHATSAPLPEAAPAPAEAPLLPPAAAAINHSASAGSAVGTLDCIAEDGSGSGGGGGGGGGGSKTRPVSWGPAIRNMQQPAALNTSPSGSWDLDRLHPTPQRTVAEALTSATMQQSSVRAPSSGSDEAKGTVTLDELRLCHRHDGQPFILGKGNFGTVYKALLRDEELVAVKVFPIGNRAKGEENFRKEITLLRKCANEHIVAFRAACLDAPGNLLMAMELMKCDLRSALHEQADRALLWYYRNSSGRRTPGLGKQIALDIARGLQFLHECHIVHLDLKSPNVLLTEDNEAKIGDVGLARFMPNDYMSAQAAIGAFVWSAPEVLMGAKCSEKVDIYSYGVILWELVTGESPQRGRMRSIRVPEECPAGVADLVNACMERDPAIRPSAADIAELLSGDPAALQRRLDAHASTDSVCGDSAEEPIPDDDRVRLQQLYNQCNYTIWQGPEAAAAAGYSEPPLDSVVEGIRPFDGKSYSDMIRQLKELLESADIEDTSSAPRRRLEELISAFRPLYATKLKMSTRVFQELKHTDVNRLGKLVDQLLGQRADGNAGTSTGGGRGNGDPEAAEHTAASAADAPATSAEAPVHADARSGDSKGSSGSSRNTGGRSGGASGSSGVDEYAADKDPARRAPPDAALWNRVLDEMRLTPEQLEALAEARLRVGVRLQHLQSERSALVAKLQALSDPQDVEMYEQAAAAAADLRTNMRLEGQANHLFLVYVMVDLLDAIQYARGECCAWPAMLDAAEVGMVALQRCRQGITKP